MLGGTGAAGCGSISIGGPSGAISNTALLDYETTTICTLIIRATDGGTPALNATSTVLIDIQPVNEATPTFGAAIIVSVPENIAVGMGLVI